MSHYHVTMTSDNNLQCFRCKRKSILPKNPRERMSVYCVYKRVWQTPSEYMFGSIKNGHIGMIQMGESVFINIL